MFLLTAWQVAISIHSLRMEGDVTAQHKAHPAGAFQSTPSAWRETALRRQKQTRRNYFNPLPPHGGRLVGTRCLGVGCNFNPLPPHGGRRKSHSPIRSRNNISIHSLRMEGDRNTVFCFRDSFSFQSTPSAWRETTPAYRNGHKHHNFNPLPPHGGRPDRAEELADPVHISIHSLRMEGDPTDLTLSLIASSFQSTPSAWRETPSFHLMPTVTAFQSTPSAWRETFFLHSCFHLSFHFNPLPPHGGRR